MQEPVDDEVAAIAVHAGDADRPRQDCFDAAKDGEAGDDARHTAQHPGAAR